MNDVSTGGRWSDLEKDDHINVLEMRAILLGLQSFFSLEKEVDILVKSDNTTAIAYLNKLGGSKSSECELVTKEIWKFCERRNIWVWASHIPGVENETADYMSRHFTDNTEWSLNPNIFDIICEKWGIPDVDLFASRLNNKVPTYVSWRKDPHAKAVNAFSVDWNLWNLIYLFPPFSLIAKCLKRIRTTSATVILVVPKWPGQVWFSKLRSPLVKETMTFPPRQNNLIPQGEHLQKSKLTNVPLLVLRCE